MRVSLSWLKELADYSLSPKELADKLSLMSMGVKQQTGDYLELDLTYNRGDLLSLRGVAREVAAITNSKVTFEDHPFPEYDLPEAKVDVENKKLCPVYCVAKIENLKVEKSNDTWVKKLSESGIRSVNSIADVTNLIMLQYGQPMHAFDTDKVEEETLIVRCAKQGEELTTLDEKIRNLDTSDLLITDCKKPLGIAGVMGGKESEVSQNTTSILLEAAIFDPVSLRGSSQRHGLHSEASKRFQHGLTKTNLLQALTAAIKMYEDLGGKLTTISLIGNLKGEPKTIQLNQEKVNSLIGMEIPAEQIEDSLRKLGFKLETKHPEGEEMQLHLRGGIIWEVTVPYFRLDIQIEEDLIEEVARMFGYEKIPAKPLQGELPQPLNQDFPQFIYDLKKALSEAGLTEVQTYSFYSTQVTENLRLKTEDLLKIANPISAETKYLRDNLWPNLLEVVAKNIRNGIKDVVIFELGKVYSPKAGDLPKESYRLSIASCNGTPDPIQELYQIFQHSIHLRGVKAHLGGGQDGKEYFHPTRFASIGENGWITEIHPRIVNKFGVEQRVAVLEIEIKVPL